MPNIPQPVLQTGLDPSGYTSEAILAELTEILVEVIGTDFLLTSNVNMETSFNKDIALESIQFVLLAEELRTHYGDDVDFVGWLAGMDLDAIVALRVGQLVEFILGSLVGTRHG
jgi:acyl carrier protein